MKQQTGLLLVLLALALPALSLPQSKVVLKSKWQWLEVDAYTIDFGRTALRRAATQAHKRASQEAIDAIVDWRTETGEKGKWSYWSEARVDKIRPSLISFTHYSSTMTTGNHPHHEVLGFVFLSQGGKVDRVTLGTMFRADDLSKIERQVREKYNSLRKSRSEPESVLRKSIDHRLLENFTVTGRGVTFLFPHYSLATYSEGAFEIFLPWTILRPSLTALGKLVEKASA